MTHIQIQTHYFALLTVTTRQTHTQVNTAHTAQQTNILIHMLKCCRDLWHTAAPQPGSKLLYVSICGEHLWQMGDTLKSHRPLHFPKEQLPGTTNHSSVHFSSSPFFLPSPQAPATAGERFNTTYRRKWQNRQAHEKKKLEEGQLGRGNCGGDLDLLADERKRGKIHKGVRHPAKDMQQKTGHNFWKTGMN